MLGTVNRYIRVLDRFGKRSGGRVRNPMSAGRQSTVARRGRQQAQSAYATSGAWRRSLWHSRCSSIVRRDAAPRLGSPASPHGSLQGQHAVVARNTANLFTTPSRPLTRLSVSVVDCAWCLVLSADRSVSAMHGDRKHPVPWHSARVGRSTFVWVERCGRRTVAQGPWGPALGSAVG